MADLTRSPHSLQLSALLSLLQVMSSSVGPSTSKPPRGRRPAAKVPCDECIQRASLSKEGNIELCGRCTAVLHRQRKPQKEIANVRRVRRQSHAIIDTAIGVRTAQPSLPWSNDRQEQHSLQFFIRHSAPQLAGYFDSPFWQHMVLVAARHEPSVLHSCAAIGALHEKLMTGAVNPAESHDKRTRFALEQCNKSIQHLLKPSDGGTPDLRLMLTTCVLFTCFEALQGNCEQAIRHATQGYNLLQQYAVDPENGRWNAGAFAVELDQLCMLMRRLQTQGRGLMGRDFKMVPNAEQLDMRKPTRFEAISDARGSLEQVLNQLTMFFLDLELDDQYYDLAVHNGEKHILFTPWLEAWEMVFSDLLSRISSHMSPTDRKAAMILKAHHLVAEILANVDLSLGELGWDAFQEQFAAIVNLATAVLEETNRSDASVIEARWKTSGVFISSNSAMLSFSLGIVDPLYEVVARCRDPVLRRRAMDLLATHPRQECMWSSWSAWKVGKFLIRLEEEGIATQPTKSSDIPVEQRISEAWLDFGHKPSEEQPGRPRVAYKRALPRASARYALNPGLFDWRSEEPDFIPSLNFATVKTPTTNYQAAADETGQSLTPDQ